MVQTQAGHAAVVGLQPVRTIRAARHSCSDTLTSLYQREKSQSRGCRAGGRWIPEGGMHETTVYVCASKLWGAETLRHHTSLLSLTQVVSNKISKNHVCPSFCQHHYGCKNTIAPPSGKNQTSLVLT